MSKTYTPEEVAKLLLAVNADKDLAEKALLSIEESKFKSEAIAKVKELAVANISQDEKRISDSVTFLFSVAARQSKMIAKTEGDKKSSHSNSRADKQGIELKTPSGRLVVMLYTDHEQAK